MLPAPAFFLGDYHNDVYRKLLLWVTLALGYNFLFGICGQVAFSHFAFYGIGAYSVVILLFQLHLPLPLAIVLRASSFACCSRSSVAIPSTRLEGFYLALATLALAQLFIVVLNEGGDVTGGTGGIANYRLPDDLRHAHSRRLVHRGDRRCSSARSRCSGASTTPGSAAPAARCATTRRPPRRWAWTWRAPR